MDVAIYGHPSQSKIGHKWPPVKRDEEKELVRRICKKLVEIREEQGISQQKLSELAGISRTGLRHVESLETNPTLYSLLKIAKALQADFRDLMREGR
jgi:putative transcriptional regulator